MTVVEFYFLLLVNNNPLNDSITSFICFRYEVATLDGHQCSSTPKAPNSMISVSHKAFATCQTSLHQSLIWADFVVACDPTTSSGAAAAKPCRVFI